MTAKSRYPDLGRSSAMFTQSSLPTNEELPFLPPIPDTPQHAYKSYLSEDYVLNAKTPLTRQLWEERSNSPVETSAGGMKKTESSRKWDVEVDYPVLTTRQSVFNTPLPINRNPSGDYFKPASRTPSPPKAKDQSPTPEIIDKQFIQHDQVPTPHLQMNSEIPNTEKLAGDQSVPFFKAIDSMKPTRSPAKAADCPQQQPRISASFNLPTYIAEASLLAEESLMGGGASSADGDSFHLGIDKLRPKRLSSEEREEFGDSASLSDTPTKPLSTKSTFLDPLQHQNPLDQSTLLPRSPAKTSHLLEVKNAISNVEPPWSDDSQLYGSSISSRENSISPEKYSSPYRTLSSLPHSAGMRGFPTSSSSHSVVAPLTKTKRTFPASSSSQSLSSVCEDEYHFEGEVSTLLPVSPMKTAHLLTDAEMISKEKLEEGQDARFRLPLPTRATPYKPSLMGKTPRKSPPAKMSPIKTIVTAHKYHPTQRDVRDEQGDITLDVKDLLAKMNKPKRASGTEESFVDLLHDEFMPDGLDASMIGPDESMLPPSLRPRGLRGNSTSPIKTSSYASPIRPTRTPAAALPVTLRTIEVAVAETSSPIKQFPSSQTTHNLASQAEEPSGEPKQQTISRSKSLSRVAEIIERVKSERAATQHTQPPKAGNDHEKEEVLAASPPKTAIRTRTYTRVRTPATSTARPRNSMMPPPATSKKISLSAGALPMPGSASHKSVDLPPARTAPRVSTIASKRPTTTTTTTTTRPTATTTSARLATTGTAKAPVSSQTSMAPPTSRVDPRVRPGSISSTVSSSAMIPSLPTSRTTRPSTTVALPSTGSTTTTISSRVARPSTVSRLNGLPKSADGPTTRSAPAPVPRSTRVSRPFGTDATSATNRTLNLPSRASKMSTGPSSSTARSAEGMKSRAMSTPASATVSKATNTDRPPLPTSRITRPSTIVTTAAREGMKKSSLPPPLTGTSAGVQRSRIGSTTTNTATGGLPRPSTKPTSTAGKGSAPPTSTGTSAGAGAGTGLSALRERLDRLHARQVR
ncbi:hypothetical protein L486_02724 [Kwoniella mangroviensis CBS 10435]|uniref:Uncharacterized protein n=1 Tax=Kwoniella mangroviensis CBS 10435 TaxID=1331196 RepID=A0A1B9IWZ5_9TREE|nr:hypothetical protein L486_02724 [Kwoniella mangroviensis CBS 10435]